MPRPSIEDDIDEATTDVLGGHLDVGTEQQDHATWKGDHGNTRWSVVAPDGRSRLDIRDMFGITHTDWKKSQETRPDYIDSAETKVIAALLEVEPDDPAVDAWKSVHGSSLWTISGPDGGIGRVLLRHMLEIGYDTWDVGSWKGNSGGGGA